MIHEYAILPGVFEEASYSSPDACDFSLRWLKRGLLRSGLIRNLHGGAWETTIKENPRGLHIRANELLKKLSQQGRLEIAPKQRTSLPLEDLEWLDEAEQSHTRAALDGILTVKAMKSQNPHKGNALLEAVESLDSSKRWCGNRVTEEVLREPSAYLSLLSKLMRTSRSMMFIDPHLDPSEIRYEVVADLIRRCHGREVKPLIEIHRVAYKGRGGSRSFPDWEAIFRTRLGSVSACADSLKVFIWDDFHDRALLTNLVGIQMSNGFDIDMGKPTSTNWASMDRDPIDQKQREFDPASSCHKLVKQFRL